MSTLWMIRHGQASFGSDNYDQLSELGYEQSRELGRFWSGRGMKFDALYCGEQMRQKQTLESVGEIYEKAGLEYPGKTVNGGFNEYDAHGIFTHFLPKVLKESEELRDIMEQNIGWPPNTEEGRKLFQKGFQILMSRWVEGNTGVNGLESWAQFQGRVIDGVKKIMADHGDNETVAVFTSGGPVSMTVQWALKMTDEMGLDISWVVKNASLTEFKFKSDRCSLVGFNMTQHFIDEKFITYR